MMFRFTYRQLGGHTHVVVRCGNNVSSMGLCGQLTFRNEEWSQLKGTLEATSATLKTLAPKFEFIENIDHGR